MERKGDTGVMQGGEWAMEGGRDGPSARFANRKDCNLATWLMRTVDGLKIFRRYARLLSLLGVE